MGPTHFFLELEKHIYTAKYLVARSKIGGKVYRTPEPLLQKHRDPHMRMRAKHYTVTLTCTCTFVHVHEYTMYIMYIYTLCIYIHVHYTSTIIYTLHCLVSTPHVSLWDVASSLSREAVLYMYIYCIICQ